MAKRMFQNAFRRASDCLARECREKSSQRRSGIPAVKPLSPLVVVVMPTRTAHVAAAGGTTGGRTGFEPVTCASAKFAASLPEHVRRGERLAYHA